MSTITQFPSGNTQYRIEFDYLARTFVVVTLVNSSNPTLNRVLEVGRDYRFLNPTMIEMLVDQSGFDIVRIHRQTGTDLVVDFRNGSVLTASDLTNAELQSIHIAEEGRDQTVDLAKEYADAAGSSAGNAKDSEDEARRIAASIKEAALFGYITSRSFEKGFNVTKWNEVLLWEENGEYYRWDGEFPKVVPAGSTPDSTGEVKLGAWVSVGDASLRSDLSQENGAIFIDKGKVVNFIKKTSFSTGGVLINNREAVKYSDDYWYIWNGSYPKTIGSSTPDNDSNWKCVGLLNGYAVNDAQNFGFTGGMDDALPVLNAMIRSPFFNMFFPMGSEINIASDWSLRSNLDIDFHASTLNWKGAVFTLDDVDNGSEMAVINTPNFAGGTSGSLANVHLKNVSIKASDYAIGINLRNTDNFSLENVYVEKAQRQGINVSNCHKGCINQVTLKDCSPLSDKGFASSQLESWGDGLIVWYGSTNVSIDNIHVESGNNSRGGRCGIVVDGYGPAGKPDPRNISINNAYVYGYDRPMHTELCGVVTVTNSVFEYNSGSNTHNLLQCAVVTWNVLETTTFINCTFRTDMRFMKNSGAKAKFIKCNVYKTSSSEPIFVTGTESTGLVEFDSCLISHAGGAWGAWNASLIFNKCTLSSDAPGSVIDFGSAEGAPKELRISNSPLKNIGITALFAPAFTEIHLTNSSVPGDVNCGDHARLFVSDCDISGDVSCKSVMRYSGAKPKYLSFTQNSDQQYNGNWLGTGKPVAGRPDGSGDWKRGDTVLNLDATESNPYLWYCVTPGTPGRWSVAGTLSAAD